MIGVKKNVIVFFGLFLVGMLLVPTVVESAWADWTFEGFLGEPWSCPGSDWPSNCWFSAPQDVAVDNSDNIYVVSFFEQKVYKHNSAGNLVLEFSTPGIPREVDVDGSGNIYVSLGNPASSIAKYDSSGNFILQFGPYEANWVIGDFAVDNAGNIYVTPPTGGSWWKFDSSGNLIFEKQVAYNFSDGIDIDHNTGNVYAPVGDAIRIFNSDGDTITSVGTGVGQIGIDGSGNVYAYSSNSGSVVKYDSSWNGQGTTCSISDTATAPFDLNPLLSDICKSLSGESWSSDGARFAVNSNGDVYAMGSPGGNTHAVLIFSETPQPSGPPSGTVTISSQISLLAADPYTGVTDPTGGDCTQIGTWDVSTKTCTLTADVIVTSSGEAIYVGQTIEYISTTGIPNAVPGPVIV